MVPRLDMVSLEAGVSLEEAAAVIVANGHSRLPVYNGTIDDVCWGFCMRGICWMRCGILWMDGICDR